MPGMDPEDLDVTALLVGKLPVVTVDDVDDELPVAFTEPLDDGADRHDLIPTDIEED